MTKKEYIAAMQMSITWHLELRKLEDKESIWLRFERALFDNNILTKKEYHDQIINIAKACGCKFVIYLFEDYNTKIVYFFTNLGQEKTAMEQLQEASYAR